MQLVVCQDQMTKVGQAFEMFILLKKVKKREYIALKTRIPSVSTSLCIVCNYKSTNPIMIPSIHLTLITVNLLESRWSALRRRRSLKAEGRI